MSRSRSRIRQHDEHPIGAVLTGGLFFLGCAIGVAALVLGF